MGNDIDNKKNEIDKRLNSFFDYYCSNESYSIDELGEEIDTQFSYEELRKIYDVEVLNDYFEIKKKKIIKDIERERQKIEKNREMEKKYINAEKKKEELKIQYERKNNLLKQESQRTKEYLERKIYNQQQEQKALEEEHNRRVENLTNNIREQEKRLKEQKIENEKKMAEMNRQHNRTVENLTNNVREQEKRLKEQKIENEKKMAEMNEQHNITVENLTNNVREQEIRLKEQKIENEKKMAEMNEQHKRTVENLKNNAFEQEKRFNEQQEILKQKFKEENAQTKILFEKKLYQQEQEQKLRELKNKEENEKQIALLNEQHYKTVEMLKQKLLEQERRQKEREDQFRKENEKKEKEANERIALMIEQHNNNIKSLEEKAREQEIKFEENQKKKEEEFKKSMEDLEKRYKEERDEEKKQQILMEQKRLEEFNEKKKQIIKDFNDKINKKMENEIEEIITHFNSNEDKFCIDDISKYDIQKIDTLICSLLKYEKINNSIMNQLNLIIKEIQLKNVEHLNIVLVGPSGVGKSTLINTLLELETQTKYGFGLPQTQEMDDFSSEKIPFLRLVDSKGIEKNIDAGTDATYNSIKNYIDKKIQTGDPDKYIHCIWYCWTGSRLEQTEIEIVRKLSEQYTLDTLPVISVYTNSINKSHVNEAKKYITETLKLPIEFVDILSVEAEIDLGDKIIIKPAYGLDKLKEISIKLAKAAVNSACYEGLTKDIEKKIMINYPN